MIKAEPLAANALKIVAPEKLQAGDFRAIAPQVDSLIGQHGAIRLLIDASALKGWENSEALEEHARFVKDHQSKVERIAVITGHEWQRWLAAAVNIFLHPEIRAFDKGQESEARQWLLA